MSLILCPAPFQRPKKKDKKPRRPNDVSVPHFIAAASSKLAAETQLDQPIVRKYPEKPPRGPATIAAGSNPPVQRKDSQHSHASSHALSSPGSHSHPHGHAHCSCENDSQQSAGSASNESHSTHTSGYQTDDGTFEGKVLHRASRDRPANLRMTAIRDYNPCCKEELAVRKGQRVKVLYKNNDWVYALTKSGEAGYIPFHFVRPSRKYAGYQSEPEFCNDHDVHMSGYDTDMPTIHDRRRGYGGRGYGGHGHRTQVGDVIPSYSVHGGFQGSPEELGSRMDTARHLSGYTSAVEYPGSSLNMHPRRYPRSARSLHCILDASLVREYSRPTERKPECDSFQRQFIEELVVIHDFEAKEEDEVFVGKGERVRVLNAEDPFWLWVETMPGDEGYIPRACCSLGDHPLLQNNGFRSHSAMRAADRTRQPRRYYYERSRAQIAARQARSQAKQRFTELARMRNNPQNPVLTEKDDIKRVGSRLIVLMDYPAPQDDELSLEFGEAVFADVLKQAGADRIWAYCPRSDKCGFIPVSLVVPPAV